MRLPEPCLSDRCGTPMSCHLFGYCRERNADYPSEWPSGDEMMRLRAQAAERNAKETPDAD